MQQLLHSFLDFGSLRGQWPAIWAGLSVTIGMTATTILIGIPLGLALAVLRLHGWRPLNLPLVAAVDLLRTLPPLVLIMLVYFGLPYLDVLVSPFWTTVLCVAAILAAYSEEVFWAAFTTVPTGQWEAGRCTGMGFTATLLLVAMPQAVRMSIPGLTNRAIAAGKSTTLGSAVAVTDLLSVTNSIQSNLANPTALTVGAALFLGLFLPFVLLTRLLERRFGDGQSSRRPIR